MRKYYYCNHCGTKNKIGTKKCLKCEKNLKMKNHPLSDYLFDQTKDDIKSNLEGSLFDKLKFFIKKYLYGFIMTLTIVGGVTSNIIVRTEEEVVTQKPNVTFSYKEYTNVASLYNDVIKYFKNADEEGLKSLLFETHYKDEAAALGIKATDNIIFTLTRDGVFKNNYNEINKFIPEEVFSMPKKFCLPSNEKCFDFSNTEYNVYNHYLLAVHYIDYDPSKGETWIKEENGKTWIGKNEFRVYFIEVDGKYYLLDFLTIRYDKGIASVKGDLSLLNYELNTCYYVNSEEECNKMYGGEVK